MPVTKSDPTLPHAKDSQKDQCAELSYEQSAAACASINLSLRRWWWIFKLSSWINNVRANGKSTFDLKMVPEGQFGGIGPKGQLVSLLPGGSKFAVNCDFAKSIVDDIFVWIGPKTQTFADFDQVGSN